MWNLEQRFAGSSNVELTELGLEQARSAGRLLVDRNFGFDLVYTSQLKRAQHTAAAALSQMQSGEIELHATWRLNERNFGELEGMLYTDAALQYGEEWGQPWLWGKKPPGGESMEEVEERVRPFLDEQLFPDLRAGRRPLVVAHGNTIRVLDELLRAGVGARLETIPTANPLLYRLEEYTLSVHTREFMA
ncbi:MAG: 2,3-bisphosphoglycerate-dependent phosphoglycerate mutase [Acidobacteriia bacterium]|nr:2,3-bisphosphoglycerate-dependent phosphoglycerate mutase [Terriglobia bacterium]